MPAIGKEGMETLRDADDAREWQDAVKSILVEEVRERANKAMDENSDFMATVHASIKLFQDNTDLVPGTREFDVELANRFATLAQPYELRVDGKLQGYSIPVQPIIDQLRTQIAAERAAAATPAAGGDSASTNAPAAEPGTGQVPPEPDPPQAGIPSKAGANSEAEDFSTLFGTIGLPDLQI